MKTLMTLALFISISIFQNFASAQNCTISCVGSSPCSIDWDNMVCDETGSAPQDGDLITITDGVTVQVTDSNEKFDGSLKIESGGILEFPSSSNKLDLTDGGSGCGNYIIIASGGYIKGNSSSNQLRICGNTIAKGGGGCNTNNPPSVGDAPPYCMNGTGLTGVVSLDENGVSSILLPLELAEFSAEKLGTNVLLEWKTSTESKFHNFELLHSKDGLNFKTITNISEHNHNINQFTYTHYTPGGSQNYYRLKSADKDGNFTFSQVIFIQLEKQKEIKIYPTLNKDGGKFFIDLSEKHEGDIQVNIYKLSNGNLISSQIIQNQSSSGLLQFNPKLSQNHYLVELITNQQIVREKLVVIE
ncbi:hypothetical protein [Flexithrix dorotheae]|uniref:hypothetical protein n=1 Tax=Flexithrix dorotheae TaxID=70993 RepID=UPI0012FC5726|nr:hypothetical protein [Flexithrix dorotheae]